jgi:hypothetical protein
MFLFYSNQFIPECSLFLGVVFVASETQELKDAVNQVSSTMSSIFPENVKDPKLKEKQNYLLASIGELSSKIDQLENTVSVGVPLTEATDVIQKLNNLEQNLASAESKLNIFLQKTNELKERDDELQEILQTKISKNQFDSLYNKVVSLEELYQGLSVSETKDTFMALINVMETLEKRIKYIEEQLAIQVTSGQEQKVVSSQEEPKEQVQPQKVDNAQVGFFGKFFDSLKKIFGG